MKKGYYLILCLFIFAMTDAFGEKKYKSIFYSDDAERYLEKWTSDKKWSDAVVKAESLYNAGKYEEALVLYRKGVAQGYDEAQGLYNIGHCYEVLHQQAQAIDYYEKAIAKWEKQGQPKKVLATAYYHLGMLFVNLKDYAKGLDSLQKAYSLDEKNEELIVNLATLHEQLGNREQAKKYYEKAKSSSVAQKRLQRLQQNETADFKVIPLRAQSGLFSKVPVEVVALDQLKPEALEQNIQKLEASLQMKSEEDNTFDRNLARRQSHYKLGLFYCAARNYPEAIQHLEAAGKLKDQPYCDFIKGFLYMQLGQARHSLESYQQYIWLHPEDPLGHFNLAVLYDNQLKQNRKAIHHYRRYLQLAKEEAQDRDEVRRRIHILSYSY